MFGLFKYVWFIYDGIINLEDDYMWMFYNIYLHTNFRACKNAMIFIQIVLVSKHQMLNQMVWF